MKISISVLPISSWSRTVGAFLGWFLNGLNDLLYVLLVFMAVDYLTGVPCATGERKLSGEIDFKGIMRKVLILVLVRTAHALDIYLLKNGSAIRTVTIFSYVSNEGISLLENAPCLGLSVSEKLKEVLKQLYGKNDDYSNQ